MAKFPTFNGSWPWPWPWIGSYCLLSCITRRPLLTYQISLKSKKLSVDGRTFETNCIRSTRRSRPNEWELQLTINCCCPADSSSFSVTWKMSALRRQINLTGYFPTRPTQPFILSEWIHWVVSNFIIGCVLVAPSGECSGGQAGAVISRCAPCVAAI